MREYLDADNYATFEVLLNEASNIAEKEEINFLSDRTCMTEHFWVERGADRKHKTSF